MSGSSLNAKFQSLSQKVNSLKEDPGNEVKLKMYALYKQATQGPNNSPKPSALNFVAKAKWEAWNGLKDVTQEQAMKDYISLVESLFVAEGSEETASGSDGSSTSSNYKTLLVENKNGVFKITLNRPKKYNAINFQCYEEIGLALKEAADDDSVVVAALTGSGSYYSAGNDLSGFQRLAEEFNGDFKKGSEKAGIILEKFVDNFIQFPKPLIGLINGPAFGISVTTLGMFDIVLASSNATFQTPFPSLGQTPEGCSSYTFPLIMGHAKAMEVLLYEKKLSAQEACERNLVTEVIPDSVFSEESQRRLEFYASLPKRSLQYSKLLVRSHHKEKLMQANVAECERLVERWTSEECIAAVMKFMSRKGSKM